MFLEIAMLSTKKTTSKELATTAEERSQAH